MSSVDRRWKVPNETSVIELIEFSPKIFFLLSDFPFSYKTIFIGRWDLERLFNRSPFSLTTMNTYEFRARISFAFRNLLFPTG